MFLSKNSYEKKIMMVVIFSLILLSAGVFLFINKSLNLLVFFNKKDTLANTSLNTMSLAGKSIVFPKDEGQHRNLKVEWWYFAGQLEDAENSDNKFGVTLMFSKNTPNILFILADGTNRKNFSSIERLEKYDSLGDNSLDIVNKKKLLERNIQRRI